MNLAILHGNTGKDPVIRKVGESKVANFSLATQSFRKDEQGNKITDWHNVKAWGKLADLCEKYVKKGSSLIIEGEIQYRKYTDKDGIEKPITEINASSIHFAGSKNHDPAPIENKEGEWQGKKDVPSMSDINSLPGANETPDDLPF